MSHPNCYWKKPFFYALGNTSAVFLAQDLTPEEDANILLLGCGDPRNILFTIYSIGEEGPFNLDFTCCDLEAAVLARNVLLFTLLADDTAGSNNTEIWNIFYHFYLDQDSLTLLLSQSQKLVELSQSIETWNNCPYASFIRMCTTKTLSQLRSFWGWYAKTHKMSNSEKKRFKNNFNAGLKETAKRFLDTTNITSARSAGPLWIAAVPSASEEFKNFWKTGITTVDSKVIAATTFPNPSFAYMSRGEVFAVHYGSDPISGFHLAPALAFTKANPQQVPANKSFGHLVDVSKAQFRDWGIAFRSALCTTKRAGKLVIRVFAGDALALCKALNYSAVTSLIETGQYTAPWTSSQLVLDGGNYSEDSSSKAPLKFNIIDTSNLVDHLGLLNLLIVTVPILHRAPSSVLYTESLVSFGADPTIAFVERICADIPAISLLLGLAPSTYVSNFNSHSNVHEILGASMWSGQCHERMAWKVVSLGDPAAAAYDSNVNRPLVYDPDQLAKFLFNIYLKMFSSEDVMSKFQKVSLHDIQEMNIIHYNRSSFATLMRLVKARTKQDWGKVMDGILDRIERDKQLLMGLNNYQALVTQIHMLGVDTKIPVLQPNQKIVPVNTRSGKLAGWSDVPSLVCVILTVPRHALKKLTDFDMHDIGTPTLQCEIRTPLGHNVLYDFHPVFGSVSTTGSREYTHAYIEEDLSGWEGTSSLVLSFWYPSWGLMTHPHDSFISFGIRSTPQTSQMHFIKAFGMAMHVYEVNLKDKNVIVVRERPNLPGELHKVNAVSLEKVSINSPNVSVNIGAVSVGLDASAQHVSTLTVRMDLVGEDLKAKLAGKANVTISQVTPCTIDVRIESSKHSLAFPFPIDGTRAKLRIARKSSYVEVIAPISGPNTAGGFNIKNFPVIMHNKTPLVWNFHRINLDRLPAIDISKPARMQWVETHLGLMFSDRERAIRETPSIYNTHKDLRFDIKDSLWHLIIQYSGLQGRKSRVFGLSDPEKGGVYCYIFATDLRLDLASHTVVLDACILPLAPKTLTPPVLKTIMEIDKSGVVSIFTKGAEATAWVDLLLVFAERCRNYKHHKNCRFIAKGIPLNYHPSTPGTSVFSESPQCACAPGNASPEFLKVKEWEPLAKLVTRVAISPIFAVSYLDTVGGELKRMMAEKEMISKGDDGCYKCGKDGKLMKCGRCKNISYCSGECQKADWKRHKLECK